MARKSRRQRREEAAAARTPDSRGGLLASFAPKLRKGAYWLGGWALDWLAEESETWAFALWTTLVLGVGVLSGYWAAVLFAPPRVHVVYRDPPYWQQLVAKAAAEAAGISTEAPSTDGSHN